MARLIDADALKGWIEACTEEKDWLVSQYNADWIWSMLDSAPTIEVTDFIEYHLDEISRTLHYRVVKDEPVKHGRWLYSSIKNQMFRVCDQCACAAVKLENQSDYNYCPFCGAKMEEE
jgi:NADH pyrophosphatase NudC (nudix superfamily)